MPTLVTFPPPKFIAALVPTYKLLVEMLFVEILDAVRRFVLRVFTLREAGTVKGTLVRPEPSPACFPNTVPAEIVEKNP